jgi:alkylhydroperoxidase family enzyme
MTRAVLDDYLTAPIDERLRATLGFLRKLTLTPEAIVPEDAAAVLAHGVRPEALTDAVYVAACFNIIDRVADSLGFDVPSAEAFALGAKHLLRFGYRA